MIGLSIRDCVSNGDELRAGRSLPLHPRAPWPPKVDLFGIQVSVVNCDHACDAILGAALRREPAAVSAFSVHALMESCNSPGLAEKVNNFAMIVADGQPVRWALNWLHDARLTRNVRGSELMWRVCERAEAERVSIYLYGGTHEALQTLRARLHEALPELVISGAESPPFRPLSDEERVQMIRRVNRSGAGLMFVGLGCPKQDHFASDHAGCIHAVQLCVGAAFDFHAGTKAMAPEWMQRRGLEWLFRLCHEPRRLWKRYLVTNSQFLLKLLSELVRLRVERLATRALPVQGRPSLSAYEPQTATIEDRQFP
jgi:N-acetylglucosaminyldiphosphoundecaprenol N-acetyl-beta-D-mannosaminyltransferase